MSPAQLGRLATKHSDLSLNEVHVGVEDYLKGRNSHRARKVAQAVQKYVRSG
jgi:hypothetical protein